MSLILRQSTSKAVSFGPFSDKGDGVTLEVGLVSAIDHATTGILLSKNGGALTIRSQAVTASTYDAYGNYIVTLSATDTNTVGTLRMQFSEAATCLPVWQDFTVVEEPVFDALFAASATGVPAAGALEATSQSILTDTAEIGAAGAGLTNIGTIATVTNLTNLPAAAALEATLTSMKGATFAEATDSLEALRNRGDAAWITATGFATPTNITAGTITTVTNLTNAPTSGDLTATMKTSVATAALTTQMTESYRANAAAPTLAQGILELLAHHGEAAISGTTKTINKLDHVTAAETFTLDSATDPSTITRAT